jgi:hypothetical protein
LKNLFESESSKSTQSPAKDNFSSQSSKRASNQSFFADTILDYSCDKLQPLVMSPVTQIKNKNLTHYLKEFQNS